MKEEHIQHLQTQKRSQNGIPIQPEQIAKSSANNIETAPVPSFALLCGRSYPYLPWKKSENPQKMGQKRFRGRLRREGGKVECGEMWSRRSCGTALATGRVEFVTMQRKGWCFLFFLFFFFGASLCWGFLDLSRVLGCSSDSP